MAVSFREAQAIVDRAIAPMWPEDGGTWYISPDGREDDRGWWVIAGAKECLVDGDFAFCPMDAPSWVVDKKTGEIADLFIHMAIDRPRLLAMTPVSVETETD